MDTVLVQSEEEPLRLRDTRTGSVFKARLVECVHIKELSIGVQSPA